MSTPSDMEIVMAFEAMRICIGEKPKSRTALEVLGFFQAAVAAQYSYCICQPHARHQSGGFCISCGKSINS